MMSTAVLDEVVALVEADPRSGQALLFYALFKTLDARQGGHMYMLKKLREFTPENRPRAYALMDLMASGRHRGEAWGGALARVDSAIRERQFQ